MCCKGTAHQKKEINFAGRPSGTGGGAVTHAGSYSCFLPWEAMGELYVGENRVTPGPVVSTDFHRKKVNYHAVREKETVS